MSDHARPPGGMMRWLVLMWWSWLVAAEPIPALVRAQAAANALTSCRQTFTQERQLAILDRPLRASGVIEIDRLQRAVRWEFTGGATLILANAHLRRFGADGSEESTSKDPAAQTLLGHMDAMLTGDWSALHRAFSISQDSDETVHFTSTDEALRRFVRGASLRVDVAGALSSLTLTGGNGDITTYDFAAPDMSWRPNPARFAGP